MTTITVREVYERLPGGTLRTSSGKLVTSIEKRADDRYTLCVDGEQVGVRGNFPLALTLPALKRTGRPGGSKGHVRTIVLTAKGKAAVESAVWIPKWLIE